MNQFGTTKHSHLNFSMMTVVRKRSDIRKTILKFIILSLILYDSKCKKGNDTQNKIILHCGNFRNGKEIYIYVLHINYTYNDIYLTHI